jgi:hypothetical protein
VLNNGTKTAKKYISTGFKVSSMYAVIVARKGNPDLVESLYDKNKTIISMTIPTKLRCPV